MSTTRTDVGPAGFDSVTPVTNHRAASAHNAASVPLCASRET
jgi:hypothetical protein